MQVLLRKSEFRQDIHCSVCGQGFRLYWELSSPPERATMRAMVLGELRDHHSLEQSGDPSAAAHPTELFRLPTWCGSRRYSRATFLARSSRDHAPSAGPILVSEHAK